VFDYIEQHYRPKSVANSLGEVTGILAIENARDRLFERGHRGQVGTYNIDASTPQRLKHNSSSTSYLYPFQVGPPMSANLPADDRASRNAPIMVLDARRIRQVKFNLVKLRRFVHSLQPTENSASVLGDYTLRSRAKGLGPTRLSQPAAAYSGQVASAVGAARTRCMPPGAPRDRPRPQPSKESGQRRLAQRPTPYKRRYTRCHRCSGRTRLMSRCFMRAARFAISGGNNEIARQRSLQASGAKLGIGCVAAKRCARAWADSRSAPV